MSSTRQVLCMQKKKGCNSLLKLKLQGLTSVLCVVCSCTNDFHRAVKPTEMLKEV